MSIVLEELTKRFAGQLVVDRVSLTVEDGELFVLLGASGSGKSTILRLIAGLSQPDGGRILLQGKDVTHLPPQQRGTGFVFQNYSIFRHMSVADNVEFGPDEMPTWARKMVSPRFRRTRLAEMGMVQCRLPERRKYPRTSAVSSNPAKPRVRLPTPGMGRGIRPTSRPRAMPSPMEM